jgi:uncharacterized protein (UPF0248 family)
MRLLGEVTVAGQDEHAVLLAEFEGVINGRMDLVPEDRWRALIAAAPDLAESNPRELVGLLIAALGHGERGVYLPAAYLLQHLTGVDHGYKPFGSVEARREAQEAWREWWQGARSSHLKLAAVPMATLIVDEIPGRIIGDDDEPPGRVRLLDAAGEVAWEHMHLKMPYDAVLLPDGGYLVNIIRARAVWQIAPDGAVVRQQPVGGYPCSLELLPGGNILVAGWDDDVPGFVREFDQAGEIVWRHEPLMWPWKAQRLANGNTLIADAGTGRVYEVDRQGGEVWATEGLGPEVQALFDGLGPIWCQRLYDGNTLVSIRALSRIVEIDPAGRVVWEVGQEIVANQYSAVRLATGNTLIADAGHHRVVEIDVDKRVVWERGGFGYPAKAYRC